MNKPAIFAATLLCACITQGQEIKKHAPHCPATALCFSGAVAEGQDFHRAINDALEFVLQPGWTIAIVPKHPEGECDDFASVVNAPYRQHRSLNIDTSYGWTAQEEVSTSPRGFRFVTNCPDYRTESARLNIVLWPYTAAPEKYEEAMAKLGTSPTGSGLLWITDWRIDHSADTPENKRGKITWIKFSVAITLPQGK